MSIQTELTRITNAKAAIKTAIEGKGVTVPDGTLLDGMAALIESIEAGGGGYEVSCGIINLAENSTTISWEHGLSKAPNFGMIFIPIGYRVTTYANILRAFYKRYDFIGNATETFEAYTTTSPESTIVHPNSMPANQSAFTVNDTTVTANECSFGLSNNNMKWLAGKPYHWICISGDIVFPYK